MTLRTLKSERNAQILVNTLHDIQYNNLISVPAGRAPDSRETILRSSPYRRHFYYYKYGCDARRQHYSKRADNVCSFAAP